MPDTRQLEALIWAITDGYATDDDMARFRADERASLAVLDDLIGDTEDDLAAVRGLRSDEREQVVADFTETLAGLRAARAILRPEPLPPPPAPAAERRPRSSQPVPEVEPGEVELQASWAGGLVVLWSAGRGTSPDPIDILEHRLAQAGAPSSGWQAHPGVRLPGGRTADALAIPMSNALGWLVSSRVAVDQVGVGASVRWLGHVALEAVRLVARGAIVPSVQVARRTGDRSVDAEVRWLPALLDDAAIDALAAAMPATVTAPGGQARPTVLGVITAAIGAIVAESIERMQLPASPPRANSLVDLTDTVIARMDGSSFRAPAGLVSELSRRLERWVGAATLPTRPSLIVQLDEPGTDGVWMVSVFVPSADGALVGVDTALRAERDAGPVSTEWSRLGWLLPQLDRARTQRGRVALSQDEAWEVMTRTGPSLVAAGFEVRVPKLSNRRPTAALRLFADAAAGTVVGANQLANVAWTVLFDDVELTAADIARLAREARPLVQSNGRWVEIDRADLAQAAAALAEREAVTQLTGAEILRQSMGLDGSGLAGGVQVFGTNWATDVVRRAAEASTDLVTSPPGFVGELRSYQAEALAWIGFLDAAELGGCLALDMGLGKTPTVLAHLARTKGSGAVLVVAPAAVVGNWAAEAARFAPELRVVVHHGASRAEADELADEIAGADLVITTYATAVRDVDALADVQWGRIVLDEAQAIKNPLNETSQQLRRLPARARLALTGTPIENGLGDLWSIIDFTNPGLVGNRSTFVTQMSGDGEAALRALNGIVLFRRTKAEPEVAAELPDKIDELDHCTMTAEQIGLYQAVLDELVVGVTDAEGGKEAKQGAVLAAITALKQICNHPAAYRDDGRPLAGRSGKLARLEELIESVFAADERILIFTHFASWGRRLAAHLTGVTGKPIACYDGSLARGVRDRMVAEFQQGTGAGAMVLSLKAGGTGLNLTSANHVVLYDRWWNPAVEDQARDRAWRIGQSRTVVSHRLVCPGTVDERVEEVVAGKRHVAELVLPRSSSLADLSADQLRLALGLRTTEVLTEDS